MAVSITSFTPNTKIQSAQVNTNFTNLKSAVEASAFRGFAWGVIGTLVSGTEQGMKYIAPQGLTVNKVWAKTSSGTCDITIQKDTTDIVTSFGVTATTGSTTTFNSTVITSGQVLTLDISNVSSATDLFIMMETQVTSIA